MDKIRKFGNTLALVAPSLGVGLVAVGGWYRLGDPTTALVGAFLAMLTILIIRVQQMELAVVRGSLASAYEREAVRDEVDRKRTEATLQQIREMSDAATAAINRARGEQS